MEKAADNTVPSIGRKAPDFTCEGVLGKKFCKKSLSKDFTAKGKWAVLVFYPADFTFVCPTEIIAYSNAAKDFRDAGAEVAFISCDSKFVHLAWVKTPRKVGGLGEEINFPILADANHEVAKKYGVYIPEDGMSWRGLFLIDPKGNLRTIHIHHNDVGRNPEETIRIIQAFNEADTKGVVCPAGWKKGAATIVPNPEDSQKYFSTAN